MCIYPFKRLELALWLANFYTIGDNQRSQQGRTAHEGYIQWPISLISQSEQVLSAHSDYLPV
jgi:hypothetical protein